MKKDLHVIALALLFLLLSILAVYYEVAEVDANKRCAEECADLAMAPISTPTQIFPRQFQCYCDTASTSPGD